MAICNFNNTITERDMDILLAQAVITDPDFCRLLVDKTDLKGCSYKVISVEVSKSDSDLGESDITVVVDVNGEKYGLLIEDKVDAIAMKDQHARYLKRGEKGIKNGDYKDYRVFIFCPLKYREGNNEAKKYEHVLTYEECQAFFDSKEDVLSEFRSQQIAQGIKKAKTSSVTVDPDANSFFKQYSQYQKEYYPTLMLTTKESSNGWWSHYSTDLGNNVYIHHKIMDGTVDLTFNKAAKRFEDVRRIAEWAKYHGIPDAIPQRRGKASSIRIKVPPLNMRSDFEKVSKADLEKCFEAIRQLSELASIIEIASSLKNI